MAKKNIKISKEELEQDEVLEFADHVIFWLKQNANKILTVLSLVFLGYAGMVFWNQQKDNKLQAASDELYAAMQVFDRTLANNQWATPERRDGMRQVVTMTDTIIEKYGDTEVARNALFLQGNAYYFAGDGLGSTDNTEDAIEIFERYANEARDEGDGFEQSAALLALGYAYENLFVLTVSQNRETAEQSLQAALNYYNQITEIPDAGFLRYEAMNAKGRLLEYLGRTDEAKEVFREVAKAAYRPVPEPEDTSVRRQQIMYQLRTLANQFTTGRTALLQLQRMGEDTTDLENPDGASEG